MIPAPGDDEFVCEGVTRGELKRIVREGKEQVNRIEETGLKIMNHTVRVMFWKYAQLPMTFLTIS